MNDRRTARVLVASAAPIIEGFLSLKIELCRQGGGSFSNEKLCADVQSRFLEIICGEDLALRDLVSVEIEQFVLKFLGEHSAEPPPLPMGIKIMRGE